jgi:hypothetical protein
MTLACPDDFEVRVAILKASNITHTDTGYHVLPVVPYLYDR